MSITQAQEMDRADEEAIYSNADIMNDDLRRGMEDSDANRLQCTGRDSVWKRMYRAAVVCLVLLCVLLLIVIIVLRVQLNTETHQHQTDSKIFTNKRDQLLTMNTELMTKRQRLLNNNIDLVKERNQLINNNTDLVKERNQLINNNTDLVKVKDKLLIENVMLKSTETLLVSKIAKLTCEIKQLLTEKTNQSKTNLTWTNYTSLICE
ncbi:hypothetical protein DPX16_10890 [Anabarilius grahami]|uniref:Uncharacterized protein n=1 Tax=Anabarilius grahami TaxID=495550 RepID=A0A3N0Z7M3_ANAGA|nr:hypothetical protein DPX16_10890 [Anabarilius grahami]